MPTALKKSKITAIIALSLFSSSCAFYPKKIEYYDDQCNIIAKKMVLETEEMKVTPCSGSNSNDPDGKICLAYVGGIITLSAASAIVSGSLVVVGNTVYWLEKEGRCIAKQSTKSGS